MGIIKRADRSSGVEQSPAVRRLSRLSTPDLMLAGEQSIMAAGQAMSKIMGSDDPGFYLDSLGLQLAQAQAVLEVLRHRS